MTNISIKFNISNFTFMFPSKTWSVVCKISYFYVLLSIFRIWDSSIFEHFSNFDVILFYLKFYADRMIKQFYIFYQGIESENFGKRNVSENTSRDCNKQYWVFGRFQLSANFSCICNVPEDTDGSLRDWKYNNLNPYLYASKIVNCC